MKFVTNPDYIEREGMISSPLSPIVAFSFLHSVYNMARRNEIIVGGNQLIFNKAQQYNKEMREADNTKSDALAWFLSNYKQNKHDINALLNKNVSFDTASRLEASFEFPVFSLPNENEYSLMLLNKYEQVATFNERLLASFNDEVRLSNQFFNLIFERLYGNLYPIIHGDKVQIIYLPYNVEEYINYVLGHEDVLNTVEDRQFFTQTYSYIEEQFLMFLYHRMGFAALRLQERVDDNQYFYYDVNLSKLKNPNGDVLFNENDILMPELYKDLRTQLVAMLDRLVPYYSHLFPEVLNTPELNNEVFTQLDESSHVDLFAVAMASGNMHLLLRLLELDNQSLYTTIQYRHPVIMNGIIYIMSQTNFLYLFMNEAIGKTPVYYEDSWRESPMKISDIIIDFIDKLEYYPNLLYIIESMIDAADEDAETKALYPESIPDTWYMLRSIKGYEIPTYAETSETVL